MLLHSDINIQMILRKHHKYLNMNRISHFSEHREEIIVFPISAINGGLVALTTEKFIEKQLLNLA